MICRHRSRCMRQGGLPTLNDTITYHRLILSIGLHNQAASSTVKNNFKLISHEVVKKISKKSNETREGEKLSFLCFVYET